LAWGCEFVPAWSPTTSELASLTGSYDLRLVGLSALIAIELSYAGFELTERMMAARSSRGRTAWLVFGSVAMGIGVWTLDYLSLLALQLPVAIHYHYPTLILALVWAIFPLMVGLSTTSRARRGIGRAIAASIVVGTGVTAIPFFEIAALRLPASLEHRWGLALISVAFAIVICLLILLLVFAVLYRGQPQVAGKLTGAVILGIAVAALPYLSMATVRFHPSGVAVDLRHTISRSWMGVVSIASSASLILVGTIIASIFEGMLESEQAIATAARDAELQFRTLAEAIPQIVWTTGPDGQTMYINKRWYEMTGTSVEGSLGTGWMEAVHPDDRGVCQQKWKESLRTGEPFEIEYRLHDASQGFRWYLDRAVPLRDASGTIVKWFGTCTDIDDQMHTQELLQEQIKQHTAALFEANERLQHESIHDPLTGLYNRRFLEDTMEREARRAVRAVHGLSVIMFDLDHFKQFNDTYGHDAGDAVLRETASLLARSVRAEDIVCRYGGEEFVIILPMADFKTACVRAQRIRDRVRELNVLHQGFPVGRITISGGVAALPGHGVLPKELLKAADAALYRAKREGRDRIVGAASTLENVSP
jgi:diguanylate cyclase (GGDEF)-like protein/PAS domain S-box-containing protein